MAKRIIKPNRRLYDLLTDIHRNQWRDIFKKYPTQPEPASPSADDWQRFKRDFVDEYAGEKVQATGMTHSDFFDYFKNGTRECDKPMGPLKRLLKQLGEK